MHRQPRQPDFDLFAVASPFARQLRLGTYRSFQVRSGQVQNQMSASDNEPKSGVKEMRNLQRSTE